MTSVDSGAPGESATEHRRRHHPVAWILIVPLIGTLVPEFYNRAHPSLGGMPFFYWYQLVWIAGSVACTYVAYRVTRSGR